MILCLLVFLVWMFSLSIHECAHASVAYLGGDYTVKDKGYLSLNPLKFTSLFQSIVFPMVILFIGGLGLPGACVYIETHLLRSRNWDCLVSLAGPASNLVLAIVFASPFYLGFVEWGTEDPIWEAIAFIVMIQVMATVFNLLPIPGLDGFGAISAYMEPGLRARIYQSSQYAIIIFILILWNVREANLLLWHSIDFLVALLGVDPDMGHRGMHNFLIL